MTYQGNKVRHIQKSGRTTKVRVPPLLDLRGSYVFLIFFLCLVVHCLKWSEHEKKTPIGGDHFFKPFHEWMEKMKLLLLLRASWGKPAISRRNWDYVKTIYPVLKMLQEKGGSSTHIYVSWSIFSSCFWCQGGGC